MDKEVLFARKAALVTDTVPLGAGVEVTIRALTRDEVTACRRKAKGDEDQYEFRLIAMSLVDPKMTHLDVALYLKGDPSDPDDHGAPAGDSVKLLTSISELSGLSEGAQKSDVLGDRDRP